MVIAEAPTTAPPAHVPSAQQAKTPFTATAPSTVAWGSTKNWAEVLKPPPPPLPLPLPEPLPEAAPAEAEGAAAEGADGEGGKGDGKSSRARGGRGKGDGAKGNRRSSAERDAETFSETAGGGRGARSSRGRPGKGGEGGSDGKLAAGAPPGLMPAAEGAEAPPEAFKDPAILEIRSADHLPPQMLSDLVYDNSDKLQTFMEGHDVSPLGVSLPDSLKGVVPSTNSAALPGFCASAIACASADGAAEGGSESAVPPAAPDLSALSLNSGVVPEVETASPPSAPPPPEGKPRYMGAPTMAPPPGITYSAPAAVPMPCVPAPPPTPHRRLQPRRRCCCRPLPPSQPPPRVVERRRVHGGVRR